jgi:hypothetical protein
MRLEQFGGRMKDDVQMLVGIGNGSRSSLPGPSLTKISSADMTPPVGCWTTNGNV